MEMYDLIYFDGMEIDEERFNRRILCCVCGSELCKLFLIHLKHFQLFLLWFHVQ